VDDKIYVRGYSGSISAEKLSEKIEELAQKSEDFSSGLQESTDFLLGVFTVIENPYLQQERVANLLLKKVFRPIKQNFYNLDEDDRRFYVSMNLFTRATSFSKAASSGFGVFAHAQPLVTLGKNSKELKHEFFPKKCP